MSIILDLSASLRLIDYLRNRHRRRENKALRDGAERIVNLNQEDFVAGVIRITFDRGVDLVIDSPKGKTLDRSFDAVKVLSHVA